jgi:adenosylmethionine-8-amino-7-oxononanoate aminotransferase
LKGIYVYDVHGKQYLDANSGLWNMVAGFDHKGLAKAAADQYAKLAALTTRASPRRRLTNTPSSPVTTPSSGVSRTRP